MRREFIIETIEELAERWEMLKWELGIEKLRITENFNKQGSHSFVVHGLAMELDDIYACCTDYDNMIIENRSILMMFLEKNLLYIHIITENNITHELLEFVDGNVLIEVA